MPVRLRSAGLAADDPTATARFWATLLDRTVLDGTLVPGDATQLGLRFVASRRPRSVPDRMHVHVTSADDADQQATALELGARHLDVGAAPGGGARRAGRPGRRPVLRHRAGQPLPRRLRAAP